MKVSICKTGLLGLCFVLSCSAPKSTTYKDNSTCEGHSAKQSYQFLLSTYLKVPPGMLVQEASDYLNKLQKNYDYAVQSWLIFLLSSSFQKTRDNELQFIDGVLDLPAGGKRERSRTVLVKLFKHYSGSIIRTGPFNFILCDGEMCSGLVDPNNKKKIIEDSGMFGTFTSNSGVQLKTFYVDGVDPAIPSSHHEKDQYHFSVKQFFIESGFPGGTIFNEMYFHVSSRERATVCRAAALKDSCFDKIEGPKVKDNHDFYSWFIQLYPFIYSLRDNANDGLKGVYKLKNSDPSIKMAWDDAISKDIFLQAGTKVTKKVQGDWIIYQIRWDPTLFCKYGKPISDLYTH